MIGLGPIFVPTIAPWPPGHGIARVDLMPSETDAACPRCGLRYMKAAGVSCIEPGCPVQVRSTQ